MEATKTGGHWCDVCGEKGCGGSLTLDVDFDFVLKDRQG